MLYDPFAKPIDEFQGQHRFLSNFYPVPIYYYGEIYPTVEHAYHAGKTLDRVARQKIRETPHPGDAKRLGRKVHLRANWEEFKMKHMLSLLRRKFHPTQNPKLYEKLMATGEAELIENNYWGDTFWGMCGGAGQNHLGKLLMQVREELRAAGR